MTIWVFPSGDIHLVRAATPTNTVDIRVVTQVPSNRRRGAWEDASTLDGFQVVFQPVTAIPATVQHAITNVVGAGGINPFVRGVATPAVVSPSTVAGASFHRVIVAGPQVNVHGVLRVTTHENVTALAGGDVNLSVYAGESNRVITVYARFSDGAFEDVTGHPWLRYTPAHPALATVDAEGRITGVSAGNTTIHVTTWDGRFGFDVPIIVQPALSGPQAAAFVVDELKRKTASHAITLFVCAESYDDERRFFEHARKVVSTWIGTQPYKRLADSFHAVGVFRHSFDRHITIGPRLVTAPGLAADQRVLWEPATLAQIDPAHVPADRMLNCDTQFGLMAGTRVASTPELARLRPGADAVRTFLRPRHVTRSIQVDDRRLPRFGLDDPAGFVPIPPNAAFPDFVRRWLTAAGQTLGANDRVAFLIDEELYAGMNLDVMNMRITQQPMIAVTCGKEPTIGGVTAFGPLFGRQLRTAALDASATGSRFAHELAHSYQLADEYENDRRRVYTADDDSVDEVEAYENVQHDVTLRRTGTPHPLRGDSTANPALPLGTLDVTRIKWNIHRIAKISPASAIAASASGQRLTLARGQAKRWKPGERAFVRNSLVTPKDVSTEPRTTALDVQIVSADSTHDTVEIRLPAGSNAAVLGAKPLLYVPKSDGGIEQGLIHPAVLAFLAANGPFPKPTPCDAGTRETWDNDVECPPISGFKRPSNNADAIGLYEGGADISCDVFRPSGRCKMRKLMDEEVVSTVGPLKTKIVVVGFCFVCQYVLVELIDPSKHEGLDNDYPRDC